VPRSDDLVATSRFDAAAAPDPTIVVRPCLSGDQQAVHDGPTAARRSRNGGQRCSRFLDTKLLRLVLLYRFGQALSDTALLKLVPKRDEAGEHLHTISQRTTPHHTKQYHTMGPPGACRIRPIGARLTGAA